MSSDDTGPLVLSPDMLQERVKLVDVADLTQWDGPFEPDVGAAHTFMGTFGQFSLPVVVDGEVVYGQEFVAAEVMGAQFNGQVAVLDVSDLDWPREKLIAAVLGLHRLDAMASVDAEQLLSLLHEVREADAAWLTGAGYDGEDLDAMYQQIQRDQEALDAAERAAAAGVEPEAGGPPPTLAERFGVPPFSVLDARQGYWQARKRRWIDMGIASGDGRGEHLRRFSGPAENMGYDRGKPADPGGLIHRGGPDIAGATYAARAEATGGRLTYVKGDRADGLDEVSEKILPTGSGTSIFDPVLCELLYRWFSPSNGRVLDPFAGGSVRGIVAAVLARDYVGVDLSPPQVEANRRQWQALATAPAGPKDYTPDLTPVEERGGVLVKRDDAWSRGGASGAKSRCMFNLAGDTLGIITAGARRSPQIERAALVAKALGVGCRVHVPDGGDTPEIETCRAAGAEVVKHKNGRLNVLRARFAKDVTERPRWLAVPFGMGVDDYADDVAAQTVNLPDNAARVVVPCGSGMTAAGILRGLDKQGRQDVAVVCVRLGHDPSEYLERFAPDGWQSRVVFVDAAGDFDEPAPSHTFDGLALDPFYEAKAVPFLEPGDVLWCVGARTSITGHDEGREGWGSPQWIIGDSAVTVDETLGEFDFVMSCPPYADLEKYSDDPADLSNMPYDDFLRLYRDIITKTCARLKDDRFAAFVVGDVRDPKGAYRNFVGDTVQAFVDAGLGYYNEAILVTSAGSLPIRAGRQFSISRKLGRTHQNVLVFVKGDPKRAVAACGEVEVDIPEDELGDLGELGEQEPGHAG